MGKSLIIVESPAQAKTIKKYFGPDDIVKASVGHVKGLPERRLGIDISNNFAPEYVTIKGQNKVLLLQCPSQACNDSATIDEMPETSSVA